MSRSSSKVAGASSSAGGAAASAPASGDASGGAVAKVKAARKPRGVTKPRYFYVNRGGAVSLVRAAGKKEALAMAVGDVMIRLATPEDIMAVVKGGGAVLGAVSDLGDTNHADADADAGTAAGQADDLSTDEKANTA